MTLAVKKEKVIEGKKKGINFFLCVFFQREIMLEVQRNQTTTIKEMSVHVSLLHSNGPNPQELRQTCIQFLMLFVDDLCSCLEE